MGNGQVTDELYQQHGYPRCVGALLNISLIFPHLNSNHACSNAPDFASRAHHPSNAVIPQLISVPLGFSIVSFLGIIVSSSSEVIYGEAVWSPIELLGKLLDGNPSHATRFGVWFISASFILAQVSIGPICPPDSSLALTSSSRTRQLGTNISANSVSAGCDLTALFPRFINSGSTFDSNDLLAMFVHTTFFFLASPSWWVYRGDRRTCHVSVAVAERQQQLHKLSFRYCSSVVLCFSRPHFDISFSNVQPIRSS